MSNETQERTTREDLIAELAAALKRTKGDPISKLARGLMSNGPEHRPGAEQVYALEWSLDAFQQAADRYIKGQVLRSLEQRSQSGADIVEWLRGYVISSGSNVEGSSSATSNLMERFQLASAAALLRFSEKRFLRMDREERG